jgi:hypothetical protein
MMEQFLNKIKRLYGYEFFLICILVTKKRRHWYVSDIIADILFCSVSTITKL